MKTKNIRIAALAFGVVVATAAASSSFAQTVDNNGGYPVSVARAEALRECNGLAQPYIQRDWGTTQSDVYRACMAQHHQPE
jgi:hypothetical protein